MPPASDLPPDLMGDDGLIRISPRDAKAAGRECPAHLAAKARPGLTSRRRVRKGGSALETFALGPVQGELDALEFPDTAAHAPADRGRIHPGLARYVAHAVRTYEPHVRRGDDPELRPVRDHWVAQREHQGRIWEMFTWGRRYASPDGTLREFRFLRTGASDPGRRTSAEVALAAHTTAIGRPARWPGRHAWQRPFVPSGPPPPPDFIRRVRVTEIGLLDGSQALLFDGSPEEAKARYDRSGRDVHRQIAAGGAPEPGGACADCKALLSCQALVHTSGLLGVHAPTAPLRRVSVSDLRYHRQCPAQYHLRRLHLPKTGEYGEEHRRGIAVHAWLERAHRAAAGHGRPCTPDDFLNVLEVLGQGEAAVSGEEARIGAHMLAHHPQFCPFTTSISGVRAEPDLVFHDTDANAVILAKPDLLYQEGGSPVWREIKTLRTGAVSRRGVLRRYPQLALAVLILNGGYLNGQVEGSRVELEVLYPDRLPDLIDLDPSDGRDVGEAREVLHSLAGAWHADTTFPACPDAKVCGRCPVARWCPDAVAVRED